MCIVRCAAKKTMRNVNENENVIDISSPYNEVPKKTTDEKKSKIFRAIRFLSWNPIICAAYVNVILILIHISHSHFSLVFELDTSVYTLLTFFFAYHKRINYYNIIIRIWIPIFLILRFVFVTVQTFAAKKNN